MGRGRWKLECQWQLLRRRVAAGAELVPDGRGGVARPDRADAREYRGRFVRLVLVGEALAPLERVALAELALELFLLSVGGGRNDAKSKNGENRRGGNQEVATTRTHESETISLTYIVNTVDKGIVAAVAHRQPVTHEPDNVDEAISAGKKRNGNSRNNAYSLGFDPDDLVCVCVGARYGSRQQQGMLEQ